VWLSLCASFHLVALNAPSSFPSACLLHSTQLCSICPLVVCCLPQPTCLLPWLPLNLLSSLVHHFHSLPAHCGSVPAMLACPLIVVPDLLSSLLGCCCEARVPARSMPPPFLLYFPPVPPCMVSPCHLLLMLSSHLAPPQTPISPHHCATSHSWVIITVARPWVDVPAILFHFPPCSALHVQNASVYKKERINRRCNM
jgi:hypothetical protein